MMGRAAGRDVPGRQGAGAAGEGRGRARALGEGAWAGEGRGRARGLGEGARGAGGRGGLGGRDVRGTRRGGGDAALPAKEGSVDGSCLE